MFITRQRLKTEVGVRWTLKDQLKKTLNGKILRKAGAQVRLSDIEVK